MFGYCSDNDEGAGNCILDDHSLHGHYPSLRLQPLLYGPCCTSVGLADCYLLHLVCSPCPLWDLLLFPCKCTSILWSAPWTIFLSVQVYAFARDGGIPYSKTWRRLHPVTKVPANAIWLCTAVAILIALPILKLSVVFTATSSMCTIGWVGAYAVPLFARMVVAEESFKRGPFHLGRASRWVCGVAFLWVCYTCSVFLLPTEYPIEWSTFNYAPVAVGLVMSFSMLWWLLDARKWFRGPIRNIPQETEHNFRTLPSINQVWTT